MASIVDELVVALKLDNKEFQKGAKDTEGQLNKVKGSANDTAKKLQENGKKGAEFFTQIQKTAIKFFGVLAVGTATFRAFANLISSGAHLSRLATNLGTSANTLHKWGQAVKQSGGTAKGFESTISNLSAEITAWKTGGVAGPMLQGLQALGVGLTDASGKAKGLDDLLLDMGEAVQRRAPTRPDQANLLASFGLDEGTINLILKKRKEAEALIAMQPGMDEAAARKAQEINEKWLALVEKVQGQLREMAVKHFPTIEKAVIAIAGAFERMAPVVSGFVEGFTELNEKTEGWLGNILLALGALNLIKGILPGAAVAKPAAAAIGSTVGASVGASLALKGDTAPDQQNASALMAKVREGDRDAASKLAQIQLNNQFWRFGKPASESEVKKRAADLLSQSGQGQSVSGKVQTLNSITGNKSELSDELKTKLSAAEQANGLPSGLLSSLIKQETGGKKAYLEDPSKYHYDLNEKGQRIAGHTGKVSTAFGPFGILESTGARPGYGVQPLQNKTLDEQIRFAAQYVAARAKSAGSMFAGLSGYGEGAKYANQVLGRLPGGGMSGLTSPAGAPSQSGPSITIGKVEIQTAATDAAGIARSLKDELVRNMNYGVR